MSDEQKRTGNIGEQENIEGIEPATSGKYKNKKKTASETETEIKGSQGAADTEGKGHAKLADLPDHAIDKNGNPIRRGLAEPMDFLAGLAGMKDGLPTAAQRSAKPKDIEQPPAGVGLLQLLRYLLGFISSFRTGEPYREEGMTLSERFRKRKIPAPEGFPVRLTDAQWVALKDGDRKALDIRMGDGEDAPVMRVFAKDLLLKQRVNGIAYLSHVDVDGRAGLAAERALAA